MRRQLLGLPAEETDYFRRGFRGATAPKRSRLDAVGVSFLRGYHAALERDDVASLAVELQSVELDFRGFAYEGAAMGLALLDRLTPWRTDRVQQFLVGPGEPYAYLVYVGVGWVWARLPLGFRRTLKRLDPLLGWLAFDGWGFHEGYFHWTEYLAGREPPARLVGYERHGFDQGLGRSFWFVNGGNPQLIASALGNFAAARQPDLWSGIGLAATYAGVATASELAELRASAGPHWPQLAQGSAFAAKARQRAGNLTEYTDLAAQALCDLSALDAARLCDTTLENLPTNAASPAYEIWRRRIQQQFHAVKTLQEA